MLRLSRRQFDRGAKAAFRARFAVTADTDDPVAVLAARMQANAFARLNIEDAGNHAKLASCLTPRSIPGTMFAAAHTVLSNPRMDENARVFEIVKILKGEPDA